MDQVYTLYGSYASYFTAKTRSYLRKKGIPFVERLPSDPAFRNKVRPLSGSARIPQLLSPEGDVVQDTVEILDYLEERFPDVPAFPRSPKQRTFVHLMELLGSEGLLQLAWMHRWIFEDNFSFVKMDFGRSFRPQGNDEELLKYGTLISDKMMSHGLPKATSELKTSLDEKYVQLLRLMELHLIEQPYFLGGHPSAADYAVMGALHAHLGRDPAGLRVMQDNAPRVFRWVEHMMVPEIQSPEFFGRPVEYLPADEVPVTTLNILRWISEEYGQQFILGALAFNQAMERLKPESGFLLDKDRDQPVLPNETVSYQGAKQIVQANLHSVWVSQRARGYWQGLSAGDGLEVAEMVGEGSLLDLLEIPVVRQIIRKDNRLFVA